MDEFLNKFHTEVSLTQIAYREALDGGFSRKKVVGKVNGKKVTEFDQAMANRIRQGFDETGLIAIDKEASRFAQEVTFTKDLDGVLGFLQNMVNEAPFLKQILPFVKTPSNLALQAIERSPLGIFGKNFENFTGSSRDAVRIAETRGRVAMGTTILGATALYTMSGNISGGYHPDKNIREIQQSQGMVEYAFKIPGTNKWIQYGRLDPVGMLIGTVADYTQIYQDLTDKERER